MGANIFDNLPCGDEERTARCVYGVMRPQTTQEHFEGDIQGRGDKGAVNQQRHGEKPDDESVCIT